MFVRELEKNGESTLYNGGTIVRKYDAYGNVKWTRQFGSSAADLAWGIAVYGSSVYVAGCTLGALPGQTSKGYYDAFVCKYDSYGNAQWTLQVGLDGEDFAREVSASSSAVYFAGDFYDGKIAYVYKYTVQ